MSIGYRPYLDFLLMVPPLFPLVLIPLFSFWHGTDPLIMGRIVAFIISFFLAGIAMLLFWQMRRSWLFILVGLLFFTLPMPSDKLMEIRPDNLALLFFLLGLSIQLKWMEKLPPQREGRYCNSSFFGNSIGTKPFYAFCIGVFYMLSSLTLQKMFPYIAIALIIAYIRDITHLKRPQFPWSIVYMIGGAFLVSIPFLYWTFSSGNPQIVFYSLFTLPLEHAHMYTNNKPPPLFYFQPNNIYYGQWGYGLGFIVNTLLWISGGIIGILRIFYALLPRTKNKLQELLIGLLTVTAIGLYFISSIQFPQYLLPASVWIVWNITDLFYLLWNLRGNKSFRFLFSILYCMACIFLYKTFFFVHLPKFSWPNTDQLQYIRDIHTSIPYSEYILDLDGRTLYYRYPHYVCCLPYAEFRRFLSVSIPSIKEALIRTKTKYINGFPARINFLSLHDTIFIHTNFVQKNETFYTLKSEITPTGL